jgi:hypothetical protein
MRIFWGGSGLSDQWASKYRVLKTIDKTRTLKSYIQPLFSGVFLRLDSTTPPTKLRDTRRARRKFFRILHSLLPVIPVTIKPAGLNHICEIAARPLPAVHLVFVPEMTLTEPVRTITGLTRTTPGLNLTQFRH